MWPFRRKPATSAQVREIVATIPADDLANHAATFADCAMKAKNPQSRAMHWAKFMATIKRLENEARFD